MFERAKKLQLENEIRHLVSTAFEKAYFYNGKDREDFLQNLQNLSDGLINDLIKLMGGSPLGRSK